MKEHKAVQANYAYCVAYTSIVCRLSGN